MIRSKETDSPTRITSHGVYGGTEPEKIATVFSHVVPKLPVRLMESWRQEKLLTTIPQQLERLKDFPQQVAAFISVAAEELRKQA
jgi:hypothetical protein